MATLKQLIIRFGKWEYCGLIVLVVIVLSLHLSIMMQPNEPLFDELHYVPDARVIMQGDATERPEHPALSKLFIIAGMQLFGDNAVGWRFFPIVFSIAGIVFFYLICRRLNLSKRVSYLAAFLLALENIGFVQGGIAMLDVFSLTFTLAAFWLYLKGRYVMSGVAVGLSALAKLTGAFALVVIGLHWFLTGGWNKIWHRWRLLLRLFTSHKHRWCFPLLFLCSWWLGVISFSLAIWGTLALFNLGDGFGLSIISDIGLNIIGHDQGLIGILRILGLTFLGVILTDPRQWHFLLWFLTGRRRRWHFLLWFFKRWRFLLLILATAISFLALMPLMDFGVFHDWLDPISRTQEMLSISGSITYDWVEPETGSRPWIWVLTPEVMPYWYTPHYTGMISPTLWVFIMPLVLYMIYRAIRGGSDVLFPLAWFIGTYLVWIPASLITDRVTYLFYIYPTMGAIAIGLGIILSRLLGNAKGRGIAAIYLLLHSVAFIIIAPVSLCWSIPLCLLLYIFGFWFAGLGEGFWRRGKAVLPENLVDKPPEQ